MVVFAPVGPTDDIAVATAPFATEQFTRDKLPLVAAPPEPVPTVITMSPPGMAVPVAVPAVRLMLPAALVPAPFDAVPAVMVMDPAGDVLPDAAVFPAVMVIAPAGAADDPEFVLFPDEMLT